MKELLELRKRIKKKKPTFTRTDSNKKPRLGTKWRRPRGWHNKIRLHKKGYKRSVEPGHGSPVKVKGLNQQGLERVMITNIKALEAVKENQVAVISSSIGIKKKLDIAKKAKEKGIKIANFNVEEFIKKIEKQLQEKKQKKEKTVKEKEKKQKEKEKKAEEKETEKEGKEEGDELVDKIEKEEKKKEMDKVLTKKDSV